MVGICQTIPIEYEYCQFNQYNLQEVFDFLKGTGYSMVGYLIYRDDDRPIEMYPLYFGDYLVKGPDNSLERFKDYEFNKKFMIKNYKNNKE